MWNIKKKRKRSQRPPHSFSTVPYLTYLPLEKRSKISDVYGFFSFNTVPHLGYDFFPLLYLEILREDFIYECCNVFVKTCLASQV
jgi:hypothetical protein